MEREVRISNENKGQSGNFKLKSRMSLEAVKSRKFIGTFFRVGTQESEVKIGRVLTSTRTKEKSDSYSRVVSGTSTRRREYSSRDESHSRVTRLTVTR
jgi:hypothetical protein